MRHHTGKELKIQELNSERFRAIEPDAAALPYLTEEQLAVLEAQREEAREERDFDMLIIAISLLDKVGVHDSYFSFKLAIYLHVFSSSISSWSQIDSLVFLTCDVRPSLCAPR